MKNNKQNKINKNRKSLKGKWGRVGAPPKATKFPRGAFTMESLFNMNKNQCELSLRNKVDDKLADGSLIALKTRKQKGGKVGRPKAVFVLKENFDKDKHEKADAKAKTPKTRTVVTVSATPVAPTTPPVPEATPVAATSAAVVPPAEVVAPTPEVTATAEPVATVETPAPTPASEPVIG
jgi:hypothetical protein